jgi:hypothetical protein
MGAMSPIMWIVLLVGFVLIVLAIVFGIGYFGYLIGANKELRAKRNAPEKRIAGSDDQH